MGAIAWSSVLPLIIVSSLIIYDEWVSTPSCKVVPGSDSEEYDSGTDDLKVMMVANLLLLGSESGVVNRYFRDYYMAKFFRVIYYYLCLHFNFVGVSASKSGIDSMTVYALGNCGDACKRYKISESDKINN